MSTAADAFALAVRHHQSGRLAEAEALYRQALALDPHHAPAHHHLGLLAAAAGAADIALALIGDATRLAPGYAAAWADLARLKLESDPVGAAQAATQALRIAPQDAALRGLAALAYGTAGDWTAVAALWREGLTQSPEDLNALNGLGAALIQLGRPAEALPPLRLAQRLAPGIPVIDCNLALALQLSGATAEAAQLYQAVFQAHPDQIDAANDAGVLWMGVNEPTRALACFDAAARAQPDFAPAWTNRGLALSALGRREEALASYDHALSCDPQNAVIHNNRAAILTDLGRQEEAEAAARAALALTPDDPNPWINLSSILARRNQPEASEAAARRAVDLAPDHADAWQALGLAQLALKAEAEATASLRRAAALHPAPDAPQALRVSNNLAAALVTLGREAKHDPSLIEAEAILQRILALQPDAPEAWKNLGSAYLGLERFEEAEAAMRRALALSPQYYDAQADLGAALQAQKRPDEALEAYLAANALKPGQPAIENNIGACYVSLSKRAGPRGDEALLQEAGRWFRAAVASDPDFAEAWRNLGVNASRNSDPSEIEDYFRRAVALAPNHAVALGDLGTLLLQQSRYHEALDLLRRSLELDPEQQNIAVNLGVAYNNTGQLEKGLAVTRRAVDQKVDDMHGFRSNLVFNSHFALDIDDETLLAEAKRWDEIYGAPRRPAPGRRPRPQGGPNKLLRVGFVSNDFRTHVVMRHFLPVAQRRDATQWSMVLFSDAPRPDAVSQALRDAGAEWFDINSLSDDEVVEIVRGAQLDILIDLAGHTGGNRLRLFASAPAPLQMSWIGYFDTTGIDGVDVLIADPICVPPENERWFTERVARLPNGFVCWRPAADAPDPGPLPALRNGYVTLGCANQFIKINPSVAALWAQILHAAPQARLVMKTTALKDPWVRERGAAMFAAAGAPMDRVFFEPGGSPQEILAFYQRIDIALDPFPVVGGATTCEALWMGVPVVTLLGSRFCGRHSASHVTNAGHPELITPSPEAYQQRVLSLIHDLDQLSALRAQLRADMARAPITDEARFTRNFEALLRAEWRRSCTEAGSK